jgi:hypothetical protein
VEEQLVAALRGADTRAWSRIRLKKVYPDTAAQSPAVVVLLTDTSRPGCVFGKRCSTSVVGVHPDDENSLYLAASICVTNIEEAVEAVNAGLPSDCSKRTITWI